MPPIRPGAEAEVGLCLLLAAADGEVSDAELAALTTRVGRLLGDDFPLGDLGALVEAEMSSISELGADGYVARLPSRITAERRATALHHACEVACADGLSPEEEDLLRAAGRALDVDVASIVSEIGYRKTDYRETDAADHEDPPDERTKLVAERLGAAGWSDPHEPLRAAGIDLGRIGALGLEYRAPSGAVLRVEHHTCDGTLHLHVEGSPGTTTDFVLDPRGEDEALLDALVAMQDELTTANAAERVARLRAIVVD